MTVHAKKEGVKCDECGNEDLTKFTLVEPAELRRDIIGFDDEKGRLRVSQDFSEDTAAGDEKHHLECRECERRTLLMVDILYTEQKDDEEEDPELLREGDAGMKCPNCGNEKVGYFTVYEYSTWRSVISLEGDVLMVAGHYDSEGGANYGDEHLCCDKCNTKLNLPDDVCFEYD